MKKEDESLMLFRKSGEVIGLSNALCDLGIRYVVERSQTHEDPSETYIQKYEPFIKAVKEAVPGVKALDGFLRAREASEGALLSNSRGTLPIDQEDLKEKLDSLMNRAGAFAHQIREESQSLSPELQMEAKSLCLMLQPIELTEKKGLNQTEKAYRASSTPRYS